MLQGKKMEPKLWGEEVVYTTHIINQILASTFIGMTPYEWYGSKFLVSHSRILDQVHGPIFSRVSELDWNPKLSVVFL